jgi:hypothetical protein
MGALALVKEVKDKESRSQEVDKKQRRKDEKRTVVCFAVISYS